jgi:hypothetical protein
MTRAGVKRWKEFEREVARALRKLTPAARRCLQFQKSHGAPDVKAGPLWVECKARQRVPVGSVYEATAKARKAAHSESITAVVTKTGTRGRKLISLDLRDFMKLTAHSPLWKGTRP